MFPSSRRIFRFPRRATALVLAFVLVAGIAVSLPSRAVSAQATVGSLDAAMSKWRTERDALAVAEAEVQAFEDLEVAIEADKAADLRGLEQQRRVLADVGRDLAVVAVASYMGAVRESDSEYFSVTAIAVSTLSSYRNAEDAIDELDRRLANEERRLSKNRAAADKANKAAERQRARTDAANAEAQAALDTSRRSAGLTPVAYDAYSQAADQLLVEQPACNLSPAMLAGVGRVTNGHGRAGNYRVDYDGMTTPALVLDVERRPVAMPGRQQLALLAPVDPAITPMPATPPDAATPPSLATPPVAVALVSPTSPYRVGPLHISGAAWHLARSTSPELDSQSLYDSALVAARLLCADGRDLSQWPAFAAGLAAWHPDPIVQETSASAARSYADSPLAMGSVPANPLLRAIGGVPAFDQSQALPAGDVAAMIAWAATRVGTPYSQCLGPDIRPQDPPCEPFENRFGAGYFDCSGFTSHAFARIGISIPTTTMAMDASERFMSTSVADAIPADLSATGPLRPGDLFLMDGHVGMYIGDGKMIHAIGRGLTLEAVPDWVRSTTYAVLRPGELLGR